MFDSLFTATARRITRNDLEDAAKARAERIWGENRTWGKKKPFLKALAEGGKQEFIGQKIYFTLYRSRMSWEEQQEVERFKRSKSSLLQKRLVVGKDVIKSLYYYSGWNLPKDAFLIDIYIHSRGASVDGPFKTFAGPATWDEITYVLPPGKAGFNYSLSKEDKDAIRSVSQDLWEKAKGDNLGRVIKLIDAGPILLKPR